MSGITKEQLLCLVGEFTWMWGMHFFVETPIGNFVWSDPDYNGDNSFKKYDGSYKDYCKQCSLPYGRDKGSHLISDYCGCNISVVP
jgi:hypothetical protein